MIIFHIMFQTLIFSSGFGLWIMLGLRAWHSRTKRDLYNWIFYSLIGFLILINIVLYMSYNYEKLFIPLMRDDGLARIVTILIPRIYTVIKWLTLFTVLWIYENNTPSRKIIQVITGAGVLLSLYLTAGSGWGGMVIGERFLFASILSYFLAGRGKENFRVPALLILPVLWLQVLMTFPFLHDDFPGIWIYHRMLVFFILSLLRLVSLLKPDHGETDDENSPGKALDNFCADCGISRRERDVLNLLIDHCSYKEISDALCISVETVKSHARSIYRKTEVRNRNGLIRALEREIPPKSHKRGIPNNPFS